MTVQSENEFVRLIEENSGIIHKIINLYVDNYEDQKDVYQEILLQAWKSFANFKGTAKFSTWLYKVSLNTVLNFQKKKDKRQSLSREYKTEAVEHPVEKSEKTDMLLSVIKQLNEIDKMIITLHLDGFKNGEIVDITGLKLNHVNVKLHRIKQQIINQLKTV